MVERRLVMRNTETGKRTIHGIEIDRDSDGTYGVQMPDRWFCASPGNDAEDNLEGEMCMLLDHLWNAAARVPEGAKPHQQYEARRWCQGAQEWTGWQPVPPEKLAERLVDPTFEVRRVAGVTPSVAEALRAARREIRALTVCGKGLLTDSTLALVDAALADLNASGLSI
jgi:hypothetical protein